MTDESKNKKKILLVEVVEDETPLRDALHDKFIHEGFLMLEAKNGEEGLTMALHDRPDLILLDILMPGMDGITMMKKLREDNEWGKKVPIIILTNLNPNDEDINKAITENSPAYYLVKSDWTIAEIVEKVRERLSRTD